MPHNGNNGGQNRLAVGFMLTAVLFFSFVPLVFARSGAAESPFLFNAIWRLGVTLGCLIVLLVFYRAALLNRAVQLTIVKNVVSWGMFWSVFSVMNQSLFALSLRFIDVSIATVLWEMWPILLIALMARLFPLGGYRKNIIDIFPFLAVAAIGLGFAVLSQTGEFSFGDGNRLDLVKGVALVLLAALAVSLTAYTFQWGQDLADKMPQGEVVGGHSNGSLVLFGTIAGYTIASVFSAVLTAGIGFVGGETISVDTLLAGFAGGLVLLTVADILFRKANLTTNNLGVNALGFTIPVVSLLWLAIFSEIGVVRPDFLVIGAAAIVTTNLLINFETERLLGFKALVISLWVCGTVAYLRDQFDWWTAWVAKSGGYFDVLGLSATVFALILSFRTYRLSGRIQEEDDRGFALFEELAELERQGVINSESRISEYVLTLNRREGRELAAAYGQVHRALNVALAQAQGADRERLVGAIVELNRLAHSRQRGINFGEICALFLLAGMVVGIALFSRPAEVSGLTGFLVEMFAMLFPAVILFLGFNVLDLERERRSGILEPDPEKGGYRAAFGETAAAGATTEPSNRRTVEQWISIGVGGALIVAYAGLFLHKWGLWEQITAAAAGFLP